MAQAITIGLRRFWIISEPEAQGWKAQVLEVLEEGKSTKEVGIEANGETRGLADERALGLLQQRLRGET